MKNEKVLNNKPAQNSPLGVGGLRVTIQPSSVSGNIFAPASKSSMQRACAAALVRKGESIIRNPGISNDDKAALNVIKALGATVNQNEDGSLQIISEGIKPITQEINCGESGLGIRMFTPIIALSKEQITINGEGSLLSRPMNFFDEVLPKLNVQITSNDGKLPIRLQGPLQPKNIGIDGSLSSQFLTGLLMSYSAVDANNITIYVDDLKSKPYIDLTLQVMEAFQLDLPVNNNYESFAFIDAPAAITDTLIDYTIEGDWSGGAFLLVAGAIAGNITVTGLNMASTQADKAILQALMDCGCKLSLQADVIHIGNAPLQAFQFNATDCPDLFPPLVALASCCKGNTVIEGVHRLAHKESNRAITLQEEFGKMGVAIELQDDVMIVHGGNGVHGATVHSRHDHRIAMACAIAALKADGETTIEEAEAVNKSYPNFYEHLKSLGASLNRDLG